MKELLTWCYSIFNPFVIILTLVLIPSVIANIASIKAITKDYAIKWQWIIRKEKKEETTPAPNTQTELTENKPSSFYKITTFIFLALFAVLATLYIINAT